MGRQLKKIWICNDVWMDMFPFFERVELGLTLAMLSDRFDLLVDAHFDGKSKLPIWRLISISKDPTGPKATLSAWIDGNYVDFPWPDRPLPNNICFDSLHITYIDHFVIEFLLSNHQIFDKGTNLHLYILGSEPEINVQPVWDVFVRQIWPIFTTTKVHHLSFKNTDHLDSLLRLTSPTILLDLNVNSIGSGNDLFPEAIVDSDGPNATQTAGQVLSKWLHTPRKDGQPKRLSCVLPPINLEWITNLKKEFLRATVSVSYQMNFDLYSSTPIEPFELVNEWTKEKLTLEQKIDYPSKWLLKRCPIKETAAIKWENVNSVDKLNNVLLVLYDNNWIGPLSPPAEEKEKAGQRMENVV